MDDNGESVEIKIKDIVLLDSLQQRKLGDPSRILNESTWVHYASLMADGVEFPPVELVNINGELCMVDGWHRLKAKKQIGAATIMGYITLGTMQDAVMMTYAVNQAHGLPREKGVTQAIIEKMLTDQNCSKMSLSDIGRHVGCSHQHVSKVKAHLATSCKIASGSTKQVTRNGTTYTQNTSNIGKTTTETPTEPKPDAPGPNAPAAQETKGKVQKAQSKQVVPDCLSEFFKLSDKRASELNAALNGVLEALEAIPETEKTNSWIHRQGYVLGVNELLDKVRLSRPYAICAICGGTTIEQPGRMRGACTACRDTRQMPYDAMKKFPEKLLEAQKDMKGRGWLNKNGWRLLSADAKSEALKE